MITLFRKITVSIKEPDTIYYIQNMRNYFKRKTGTGFVLLMVVFLIAFIAVGIVAFLDIATVDFKVLQNNKYSNEAQYIAQAGVEDAISRLRQDIRWRARNNNPLVVEFPAGSGNQYSVTCPRRDPPKIITSTATLSNGYKREIEVSVQVSGSAPLYTVIVSYWKEI